MGTGTGMFTFNNANGNANGNNSFRVLTMSYIIMFNIIYGFYFMNGIAF